MPPVSELFKQLEFVSMSPQQTMDFGGDFAADLSAGTVITLSGNLGSGKTTLIKGICHGLGVTAHVTSPTFTLLNEYAGKCPVYHFDFYRLHSQGELQELGLEEYFYGHGICLIEWPEIVRPFLPDDHIDIFLVANYEQGQENRRSVAVHAKNTLFKQRLTV